MRGMLGRTHLSFSSASSSATNETLPADLVDPKLGVLIDEHDLATELGVANSTSRRKYGQLPIVLRIARCPAPFAAAKPHGAVCRILRQATAVLRAGLVSERRSRGSPGHEPV